MKRLDQKISNILAGSTSAKDFIIADAKDADIAFGITAPGPKMRQRYLRRLGVEPVEAVKVYHNILGEFGIAPQRTLQLDLQLTANNMSYK